MITAHQWHATYCPCGGASNKDVEAVTHMNDLKLRPEEEVQAHKYEYRWASETHSMGMPCPTDLQKEGWTPVRQHPFWPESGLMKRERT